MLIWRAKEIFEGGSELLKAEAELAGQRIKRMLVGSATLVLLLVLALVGLLGMLIGVCILMAPALGWGYTLLTIGGAILLFAVLFAIYVHTSSRKPKSPRKAVGSIGSEETTPQADAAQARERMSHALHDKKKQSKEQNPLSGVGMIMDEAIEYAMKNPATVGSAALLAISVIGPKRSLRMISRSAGTAGLVSKVLDSMNETSNPDPGSPPKHDARSAAPHGSTHQAPKDKPHNGTRPGSRKHPASRI